ncbi:hypothetical protein BH10PSE16_BH10PSE16_29970 [soil metagenome]
MTERSFYLESPKLQITFAHRLVTLQQTHLQPALLETLGSLDIVELDAEIARLVPAQGLKLLAAAGLRAEMLFVLPLVLTARPALLTYYRTLLGYSQKEFYGSGSGLSAFKKAEDGEGFGATAQKALPGFCKLLNMQAMTLLEGINGLPLNKELLKDLSLLSVGPQWRGGRNNERGTAGIDEVFALILAAISHANPALKSKKQVDLVNAAGRQVSIALAADPDIVIMEKADGQLDRPLVAIEVKAGTDASNIHNRIGEAEKSHLKAKAKKFTEFWTVVNVNQLDAVIASQQSPTTNRFFTLSQLLSKGSQQQLMFAALIIQLTGIPAKPE